MPDDLRLALAVFSRATENFDTLRPSRRTALLAWVDEATTERERGDRVAEISVLANAGDLERWRPRQRATTANGGDGGN